MDGRLVSLLLAAVGVFAQPSDRQVQRQAVSYSHVLRDYGTPTPYHVNRGFPSHQSQVTHLHSPPFNQQLQQPYSLQQSYPLSYDSPLPFSYPVKYHLSAPSYEGKGYQTYEAQSEEQDEEEADYSASAEQDD